MQAYTVADVYNEIASEYDERFSAPDFTDQTFIATELDFVLQKVRSNDEVLDMGCGTGRFTVPLARKARKVTGLDLSPGMLSIARAKTHAENLNVELQQGNMMSMPFSDNSFDVVTCMVALMHIPVEFRQRVFDEARRVLKPGGRMIISVKNGLFEKMCPVDRFVGVDLTDIPNKKLVFTKTRSGNDLIADWHSFLPQDLKRLFATAGLISVDLKGNIPLTAWLSEAVLKDPHVCMILGGLEHILSSLQPFNEMGYYLLAEAVKPCI